MHNEVGTCAEILPYLSRVSKRTSERYFQDKEYKIRIPARPFILKCPDLKLLVLLNFETDEKVVTNR